MLNILTTAIFGLLSWKLEDVYKIKREILVEIVVYIAIYVLLFTLNIAIEPLIDMDPYIHIIRVCTITGYMIFCQVWIGLVPSVKSLYNKQIDSKGINECKNMTNYLTSSSEFCKLFEVRFTSAIQKKTNQTN